MSIIDERTRIVRPLFSDLRVFGEETTYDVRPNLNAASNLGSKKARYFWLPQGWADTVAMGCKVVFDKTPDNATNTSSITLVPWAGPLTALGQACPFHVPVTATKANIWVRPTKGGQLTQVGVFDFSGQVDAKDGRPHDVAVVRRGRTVAFSIDDSLVNTITKDEFAAAPGSYPCWEPYTYQDTDRRAWFSAPWAVVSSERDCDRLPFGADTVPNLVRTWQGCTE